jgi:hypothetical protein
MDELFLAAHSIKTISRIDRMGAAGDALCYCMLVHPQWWTAWFNLALGSQPLLADIEVIGPVEAKIAGVILPKASRSLLHQPVFLEVFQTCLHLRVSPPVRAALLEAGLERCILSGFRGAQPIDIVGAMQLTLETAMDNRSEWAIAQGDIAQYYDLIKPDLLRPALGRLGVPTEEAKTVLRLHMCRRIVLDIHGELRSVENRVCGLMTGSKTASVLSEITRWDLHVDDGSKELIVPQGCKSIPTLPGGWLHSPLVDCLGQRVSSDCKSSICINKTLASAWAVFWRKWNRAVQAQSLESKGTLFSRAVASVVEYRMPRWSWTAEAVAIFILQQGRMLATMVGARKTQEETWRQWMTRRRQLIGAMKTQAWDSLWAKRTASWQRHLARHRHNLCALVQQCQLW